MCADGGEARIEEAVGQCELCGARIDAYGAQRNENRAKERELVLKSELKNIQIRANEMQQLAEARLGIIQHMAKCVSELRKDAARYRFIRDVEDSTDELIRAFRMLNDWEAAPEDTDAAVDRAMDVSK